ncbi:hypothetical protein BH11PLA1_BH11PLA1_06210 [soil metagenome]
MVTAAVPAPPGVEIPAVFRSPLDESLRTRIVALLTQAIASRDAQGRPDAVRALRQLRDPLLEPMFTQFALLPDAALAAEGVLGESELHAVRGLQPLLVRTLATDAARDRVLTLGIEAGLFTPAQLESIALWTELTTDQVLRVSGEVLKFGGAPPRARLETILDDQSAGRAIHAAVLLMRGADGALRARCETLIGRRRAELATPPERGATLAFLHAAASQRLAAAGRVARLLAADSGDPGLRDEAVRSLVAIAPGEEATGAALLPRLAPANDEAQRRAWALTVADAALEAGEAPPARVMALLSRDAAPDIRVLAAALNQALSVATRGAPLEELGRTGSFDEVYWALRAAKKVGGPVAQRTRLAALNHERIAAEPGVAFLAEIAASEQIEEDAEPLAALLAQASEPRVKRAIIAGGLRSGSANAGVLIAALRGGTGASGAGGASAPADRGTYLLAELLAARHAQDSADSGARSRRLAEIALERADLPLTWRTQAAWLAVRLAGEDRLAIARVLASVNPAVLELPPTPNPKLPPAPE